MNEWARHTQFGTQKIALQRPGVLADLVKGNPWLASVFGARRVRLWEAAAREGWIGSLARLLVTVPVFMSRGRRTEKVRVPGCQTDPPKLIGKLLTSLAQAADTTRTDLHCEPIANLVFQTSGRKEWSLVSTEHSGLVRPSLAPDGRAYVYSKLDINNSSALDAVPRYEVITEEGDVLYVPTWTWHKVHYLEDVTAVSVSIFEFRFHEFWSNNFLFAITLLPNIFKEMVGIKTQ